VAQPTAVLLNRNMLTLNFTPFPTLETERLVLRKMEHKDAQVIFQLRSDESVNLYIDHKRSESIEGIEKFIARINHSIERNMEMFWCLELKSEKKVIGTFCLWNIDEDHSIGEIGYQILPEYQGIGLMQEAMNVVLDYFYKTMRLRTVEAFTMPDNVNSIKLLERNNFKRNKTKEKEMGTERIGGNSIYYLESRSFMTRE
jgi:ribosomal-protein-alanine N-acetyltransferase